MVSVIASATLLFVLACTINLRSESATATPIATQTASADATKIALELQATQLSLQLTQAALGGGQSQPTEPPAVQPAGPTDVIPTATQDINARMKDAKILVYENTDELNAGMYVQDALDNLGLTYTDTGSYSGHFMENLNSGTIYDLIVVDAESKDIISGDFWDLINTRLNRDNAALIVEVWYLDTEANGPIQKIMAPCGIAYRKKYELADSIYWWDPTNPIFNQPNQVLPLIHFSRFWSGGAGDQIRLTGNGDAVMLAGLSASPSDEGVLATCMGGRVIFQTFSDHDYHVEDILPLWENYIYNTLKAHFAVMP
jgi:hypothetical protein